MANEISLAIGNKKLRADSVLYDRRLQPRMIMEYKAPTISITQKVFEQIAAYNLLSHLRALPQTVSELFRHTSVRPLTPVAAVPFHGTTILGPS